MRDDAPTIAGQSEFYLAKALREFREGRRENEMMSVVAKTLTDEDIGDFDRFEAHLAAAVGRCDQGSRTLARSARGSGR